MDFYIRVRPEIFEKVKDLDSAVGMNAWNIAVMLSPYDTGVARSAITLNSNTNKKIDIRYHLGQANYIKFLEEGIGPVKKYKGYIGDKTRLAIVEQLIVYLITGKAPMNVSAPHVELRNSASVFSKEKSFLKRANMGVSSISPKARNTISKIRETQYRKSQGIALKSFTGMKVTTSKVSNQRLKASNRGISVLQQVYREMRK